LTTNTTLWLLFLSPLNFIIYCTAHCAPIRANSALQLPHTCTNSAKIHPHICPVCIHIHNRKPYRIVTATLKKHPFHTTMQKMTFLQCKTSETLKERERIEYRKSCMFLLSWRKIRIFFTSAKCSCANMMLYMSTLHLDKTRIGVGGKFKRQMCSWVGIHNAKSNGCSTGFTKLICTVALWKL
jgi:hypothetical protein